MVDFRAYFFYFAAIYQDFTWRGDAAGLDIEQASGMKHDRMRRYLRLAEAVFDPKERAERHDENKASLCHMARDGNTS